MLRSLESQPIRALNSSMVLVAPSTRNSHTLNKLASGEPVLLDDFAAADTELGEALAATAIELANQTNLPMSAISVIGSHGQTVHHRPGNHTPTRCRSAIPRWSPKDTMHHRCRFPTR